MKNIFIGLLTVALVLYPLIVYWGLSNNAATLVSLLTIALLLARYFVQRKKLSPVLKTAFIVAASAIVTSLFVDSHLGLFIYPIVINIALFVSFALSLKNGPCVIEQFARIVEPELSDKAVKYTEKVTMVWCLFFIINAIVSGYTAVALSVEQWAIYNGLIAYVLIGTLFLGEWVVRQFAKKHH